MKGKEIIMKILFTYIPLVATFGMIVVGFKYSFKITGAYFLGTFVASLFIIDWLINKNPKVQAYMEHFGK